jgi:hypothetical protein
MEIDTNTVTTCYDTPILGMQSYVQLMNMHSFIELIMSKKWATKKKLTVITNYSKFIQTFKYSFIWPIDKNGNFLFEDYKGAGYFSFDGTWNGEFIKVSNDIYMEAKSKILLTGKINIEHKGKMFSSSKEFWNQVTIGNVYGQSPKCVEDLIRYDLKLTDECLRMLGF